MTWRGSHERLDGRREWIRRNLPAGRDGFVAEDLDLVVRTYGFEFASDATGRLMLLELKLGDATFGASKERTFGLLHQLLRAGDPDGERYRGFFVVRTASEQWDDRTIFTVNKTRLSAGEFRNWLLGHDYGIESLWEYARAGA